MAEFCDVCGGSGRTLRKGVCVCGDGTQDGLVRAMRSRIAELEAEVKRLRPKPSEIDGVSEARKVEEDLQQAIKEQRAFRAAHPDPMTTEQLAKYQVLADRTFALHVKAWRGPRCSSSDAGTAKRRQSEPPPPPNPSAHPPLTMGVRGRPATPSGSLGRSGRPAKPSPPDIVVIKDHWTSAQPPLLDRCLTAFLNCFRTRK